MSRVARRVIVGRFDDASSARDSHTAAAGADARMKRRTSRPVAQTEFEAKNARVSGKKSPVAAQQDKANGWGFEVGHRLITRAGPNRAASVTGSHHLQPQVDVMLICSVWQN